MPLPIPNLDDRRFDDLVAEARSRLANHVPELTQIAPGDPAHAMIDLFAHFTETILYRANLIPERQRRVILNLLQVPIRPARPSRGLVCVDANPRGSLLPPLVEDGVQLKAGDQTFTGRGEIQPTPLALTVMIKRQLGTEELGDMDLTPEELAHQYGLEQLASAFQPRNFELGRENPSLVQSLENYFYLALTLPKPLVRYREELRDNLAGITLNMALAPADDREAEEVRSLRPRALVWELLSKNREGEVLALPLEVIADSSRGGRQSGVARLRLPANAQLFEDFAVADPMFAGVGSEPPELPAPLASERVAFWLRLSCPDEPDLTLGYLDVNGLELVGQGLKEDLILGRGTGRPDQVFELPDPQVDPQSLELEVEEGDQWVPWEPVEFLVDQGGDAQVYKLDPAAGLVQFGDGLEGGKRPPEGMRVRAASYRFGGGQASNVAAGEIKELVDASSRLGVRHLWPFKGGADAESLAQAERRIPQFLTHRNRGVTKQDMKLLAENNPVNPVARAEVMGGFMPGASIGAARRNVPGAVSIFVLPPREPALHQLPRPSKGLLKDVFEYLLQRVLIGTELYVLSPEFVPLAVGVRVEVLDPDTEQQTLQAVRRALVEYLWPLAPGGAHGEGWPLGLEVRPRELYSRVARVPGVRLVRALQLFQRREDPGPEERRWERLAEDQSIALEDYQLPELVGLSVEAGDGEPAFPGGLQSDEGADGVPAPVIPEVC